MGPVPPCSLQTNSKDWEITTSNVVEVRGIAIIAICTVFAATLGFDAVWFASLVIVNLQISFLTPPFAYSIFYLKGIVPPEVSTVDIYKGVVPFVGLQILGVTLCILFPSLVTHLPGLMIK